MWPNMTMKGQGSLLQSLKDTFPYNISSPKAISFSDTGLTSEVPKTLLCK